VQCWDLFSGFHPPATREVVLTCAVARLNLGDKDYTFTSVISSLELSLLWNVLVSDSAAAAYTIAL